MKNLTWQNPEQLFVAQVLINQVKSKCCGIKVKIKNREEAIAVLRDMVQRKKEMEKQVQEEFAKVRKEAENYYVTI